MLISPKKWSIDWGGRTLTVEVGKMALQVDASCVVRYGDTMILATVARSSSPREGIDFFPLSVEFEEKLYAAGKIKGSRFIKREGRPSDEAVLSARLIDRAVRPLFDDRIRNEVQIVTTALSVDGENDAAVISLIAASCAVAISSIPWGGPIGGARIGRKNGELILNATIEEIAESDLDLLVAGSAEKMIMVEAGAKEVKEQEMFEAMKWGCEKLQPVLDLIKQIQSEVGLEKDYLGMEENFESAENQAENDLLGFLAKNSEEMIFNTPKVSKKERNEMINKLKEEALGFLGEKGYDEEIIGKVLTKIKSLISVQISKRILEKEQRLDGRKLDEIRELYVEVDTVPRVHGSGMFMRGDTQVLSVVTLGAPGDVQTLDTMEEEGKKRYMHHYNDGPYTYGETGRMTGPGRRAIGHGALAEKALMPVLPEEENFPYAIRVVSEVLGSNGSSSMASTCGSSLCLMAAGVPIKKPVAGIAMGLASDEKGNWKILTDLQDVEDGKGGMDFKIAGTRDGITAIQMDTKTDGLNWEIVEQTVKQAYEARLRILDKMAEIIPAPRPELSETAPRIETIRINPDKIRDVIGPGGKVINKIIEETGVQIDIEQDGRVMVTSDNAEGMKKAVKMIDDLTRDVLEGEIYDGTVVRVEDFGAFVEVLPGKDGLVHVSEIDWARVNKPSDVLKMGDKVKVIVKEIDKLGRVNLSMKALKQKPENWVDKKPDDKNRHRTTDNNRRIAK